VRRSALVELVLGPTTPVAAGRELHRAVRVFLGARRVHETAAPAGLGVFIGALGTLCVADVVVGLWADGE